MKKQVIKKTESELLEHFPIKGKTEGWYFRAIETSNNCWKVEGQNQWGNKIYRTGDVPELLQAELENIAQQIDQSSQ